MTTAASVNVTRLAAFKLTVVLMPPVPLAGTGQVPPAPATHLHVADVTALGSGSLTTAPITCAGPAFDTTMVYVTVPPGAAVSWPSVLVTLRSARDWNPKSLPVDVAPVRMPLMTPGSSPRTQPAASPPSG